MPRQTSLRWPVCAAIGLALFAANAGQAVAQDDGVHVDPDSPAGKEYAFPLDAARRAAEGPTSSGGASGSAALFGQGISRTQGSSRQGQGSGGSNANKDEGNRSARAANESTGSQAGSVAAAVATSESGMSAALLTALIALGVLAIGLAVGLSLRALRSTSEPH